MAPRSSLHSWPYAPAVTATLAAAVFACAGVACSSSVSTDDALGGGVAGGASRDGATGDAAGREGAASQDAGASTKDAGSSTLDATEGHEGGGEADGGTTSESGSAEPDSGLAEDEWLTPQNQARAAVGEAPLVWDPIAAQVAQSYAGSCPMFDYNANRNTQYDALGGTGGLGENIAAGAPTQTVAGAVGSWIGEEQYYDHATNTCASGQECGHYTQIVWKSTTGVGCAKYSCTSTTNSPFGSFASGQWDFSVCDYSPPGNFVGQSPY
jgi:pathogenesis-related protein 1